jgi:hypothetical protein
LLLICPEEFYPKFVERKFIVKSHIEFALGVERVDLTITTDEKMKSDVFIKSIQKDLIELT